MRKLIFLSLLTFILSSCNNDLKLQAPYKDVSVVYCLLDQNDTTHYIRVNKVFNGQGNAYTMAAQYDSINYPVGTLTVQIQDANDGTVIPFSPTTTVPADPGIFSYPNQIVYYSKKALNPNDPYNLLITNNKTGNKITGSTNLLSDVTVTSPTLFLSNGPLSFVATDNVPVTVTWFSVAGSRIYQVYIKLFYNEIDTVKKDTAHKFIDWVFTPLVAPNLDGGYPMSCVYLTSGIYNLLAETLTPITAGITVKRTADTAQVIFVSGSDDLNTYIQLSQPSLGINQDKPFYSDIKNAVGIFTSRHLQVAHKKLTQQTIDSLRYSSVTRPLNFR